MAGGTKAVLPAMAIVLSSCGGDASRLEVRALPDPLTKAMRPGSSLAAEARGLLMLGNVGLASEAFRKGLRDHPDSVEALAGLAECYDQMGRYDLSRPKYEAALAISPDSPSVLQAFAASLDRQGRGDEARALRIEATQAAAAATPVSVQPAPVAPPPIAATVAPPPTQSAAASIAETKLEPIAEAAPTPPLAASVTVKLPPAPQPRPVVVQAKEQRPTLFATAARGPRLERISLGEVALVTFPQTRWRPEVVRRTASSTTVRFVPLADLNGGARVRLLNAARHQGLAARTRVAFNRQGWKSVTIGDAPRTRETSLILYSPASATAARRLAAQFNFAMARSTRGGPLTVLLGRDAVRRPSRRG
jgi:hypothetical protein